MPSFELALSFVERAKVVRSIEDLAALLEEATLAMGFAYFALVHHVDLKRASPATMRIDNYPADWASYFIEHRLFADDPIHRACLVSSVGFRWTEVPEKIQMTRRQWSILEKAATHGLRNGYTVPVNIPGECSGSCSFAMDGDAQIPHESLLLAELVGGFAFEAARQLRPVNGRPAFPLPRLTPRQHECLLLAIQGKSDWEISRILELSHDTVMQHLQMARKNFGVPRRLPLAIRAIYDGQISFIEALEGQFPKLWE
jgi:LuxR family quorum-sensing system transcriptional regulator CciR